MLENKKLFLLDIDGTICKGNQLVEGSAAFLKDITANGGQFVFITNNATKSIEPGPLSGNSKKIKST